MRGIGRTLAAMGLALVAACGQVLGADDDAPVDPAPARGDAGSEAGPSGPDGGLASETGPPGSDGSATITCSPPGDGPMLAFVSQATFTGDRGGAAGATKLDQICTELASAAGLPGVFKAYVQAGFTPPSSRILGDGKGWVRLDGTPAFGPSLTPTGLPQNPLTLTERCTLVTDTAGAWTGVVTAGPSDDCTAWSSTLFDGRYGDPSAVDAKWESTAAGPCTVARHLYCFQTSK